MIKLNFRCFFCTVTNSLLYSTPLGVVVVVVCGSLTTGNDTKKGNLIHKIGIVFGKHSD